MNYAIQSRASVLTDTELATDLMVLDLITHYETPLPDENDVTVAEEVTAKLHITPEIIGTEMVESEEGSYEVEVTNRADIIDAVELNTAEWQEAKIHNCAHDEPINRPCSGWEVCQAHGDIPEVTE